MRRVVVMATVCAGLGSMAALAERAQVSGVRRAGETALSGASTNQPTDGRANGVVDDLMRSRRFDLFKPNNSLGGVVDVPFSTPNQSSPILDPKTQQRLLEEIDRRQNWLVTPPATSPQDLEKALGIEDPINRFKTRRIEGVVEKSVQAELNSRQGDRPTDDRNEVRPGGPDRRESRDDMASDRRNPRDRDRDGSRETVNDPVQAELRELSDPNRRLSGDFVTGEPSPVGTGTFDFGGARPENVLRTGPGDFNGPAINPYLDSFNPLRDPLAGRPGLDHTLDPAKRTEPTAFSGAAYGFESDAFGDKSLVSGGAAAFAEPVATTPATPFFTPSFTEPVAAPAPVERRQPAPNVLVFPKSRL
jgi:hypothetical protein